MAETFNFPIQTRPTGTTDYRVRKAEFGDGYTQMVGSGALNNKRQSWACVSSLDLLEGEALKEFLDRHAGHVSFLWTPPNAQQPIRVVCPGYTESPDVASQNIISYTFNQVFF